MRLYPTGASQAVIDHPAWGRFEADKDDGFFELPDDLSDELHSFCHRGKRIWETEDERAERRQREGLARRRDPAELYDTVSGMADLTRRLAEAQLAQGNSAPAAPADPAEEIAALRKRLAELEGGTAEDGKPAEDAEDAEAKRPDAEDGKPASRADQAKASSSPRAARPAAPKGTSKPDDGKAA